MNKVLGILGLLVFVCLATAVLNPNFLTTYNIQNTLRWTALFGILSIGVAFVIITGGIDLSIGSLVGLVGCLLPMALAAMSARPASDSLRLTLGGAGVLLAGSGAIGLLASLWTGCRQTRGGGRVAGPSPVSTATHERIPWRRAAGLVLAGAILLAAAWRMPPLPLPRAAAIALPVLWVLALSAGIGLLHGVLVTALRLQPFVVTLCGLLVYRGLARWVTGDQTQGFSTGHRGLKTLVSGQPCTMATLLLLAAVAAIMWLALRLVRQHLAARGRAAEIRCEESPGQEFLESLDWDAEPHRAAVDSWAGDPRLAGGAIAGVSDIVLLILAILLAGSCGLSLLLDPLDLPAAAASGTQRAWFALGLVGSIAGLTLINAFALARRQLRIVGASAVLLFGLALLSGARTLASGHAGSERVGWIEVLAVASSLTLVLGGLAGVLRGFWRDVPASRWLAVAASFSGLLLLAGMTPLDRVRVPTPFLLLLALATLASVFLQRTIFGRYLLALGRNEEAARYSGVDTRGMTVLAYVLCALLAGVAAVLFALDINSVQPASHGNFFELYAIAAAVLGGCSLRGGEGSILGVILGTAVMRVLYNAITILGIPTQLEFAIIGAVILAGVIADETLRRLRAPAAEAG